MTATISRRVGAALFAMFALALTAPAVFGHAQLETSDPAEGGTIATPYVLVLRFDEQLTLDGSSVVVRDGAGNIVAQGGLSLDDTFTQVVEVPAVPPGPYQAHWIAITADDNGKTQGDVNFTVVAATPPPTATNPASSAPTGTAAQSATPNPTAPVAPTPTPAPTLTPAPTPAPGSSGTTGSELIVPLVLAGAVVAAVAWFLLRRRPS